MRWRRLEEGCYSEERARRVRGARTPGPVLFVFRCSVRVLGFVVSSDHDIPKNLE